MRHVNCVVVGYLFVLACATPGAAQPAERWTDWARVRSVAIGDKLILTTTGTTAADYLMAFADDSQLVVVRPLGRISDRVIETMRRVGPNWPAVLGGRVLEFDGVHISASGLQEAGVRLGALEVFSRAAVLEVRRPATVDAADVLLGIAGFGAVLAAHDNGYEMETRRRAGLPPLGGPPLTFDLVNPRFNPRTIVYRAIGGGAMPLDDVSWQRHLQGLPASLRGKGRGQ